MEVNSQFYAPAALTPGERVRGTYWIGVCVGLRAGMDAEGKRLHCCSGRESNNGRPAHSASLRRGADKSLAFLICSTTKKKCFLGWVKEVSTTKS
jgi:hypothetical protein